MSGFLLCFSTSNLHAEVIRLTLAPYDNYDFMTDLLSQSLKAEGHILEISRLKAKPTSARLLVMLKKNDVSLIWRGQSESRDKQFDYVDFAPTNNLKGHRILLIPPSEQDQFNKITTLDQFRALRKVTLFGATWSDVKIWEKNNLRFKTVSGDWRKKIFRMLKAENRGIDYLAKSILTAVKDLDTFPSLTAEKRLLLVYESDFRFYLSPNTARYKTLIERALKHSATNGLRSRLLRKYFGKVFDADGFAFEERLKLQLQLP
jgi:hypothetical protein